MVIRTPLTRVNLLTIINLCDANDLMVFQPKDPMETMRASACQAGALEPRRATTVFETVILYGHSSATAWATVTLWGATV